MIQTVLDSINKHLSYIDKTLDDVSAIQCYTRKLISNSSYDDLREEKTIVFNCKTNPEISDWLETADKETFDSSYGSQELYGTIWYTDGTWSIRGEYDGSEWWEHVTKPEFDENFK